MSGRKPIQVLPAIDLLQGKVVRLKRATPREVIIYSDDPVGTALRWQNEGADCLHIVDLDSLFSGTGENFQALRRIAKAVSIPWQFGASTADEETVDTILALGAKAVALGARGLVDKEFTARATARFGDRLIAAVDFNENGFLIAGHAGRKGETLTDVIARFHAFGFRSFILTDVTRDGTMGGPNLGIFAEVQIPPDSSISLAGGISTIEDIRSLKKLKSPSLTGIIIGRALYEGNLSIPQAKSVLEESS